jgi:hypothetical protein
MKRISAFMILRNLSVAAFDDNGEQIPDLQRSIPSLLAQRAESLGYDPDGVVIETQYGNWKLLRTENGWNRILVSGAENPTRSQNHE